MLATQHAGIVLVLEILIIGGGEKRTQLINPRALCGHFLDQFGELALQDIIVRDQLRPPAAGGNGLQIDLQPVDRLGHRAPQLEIIEQRLVAKCLINRRDQRAAHCIDIAAALLDPMLLTGARFDLLDCGQVFGPPCVQPFHECRMRRGDAFVLTNQPGNVPSGSDCIGKVAILWITRARGKAVLSQTGIVAPEPLQCIDLRRRYAAVDMRANVLRFGRRRVVDIATDVAIVVLALDLAARHHAGITGHILALRDRRGRSSPCLPGAGSSAPCLRGIPGQH